MNSRELQCRILELILRSNQQLRNETRDDEPGAPATSLPTYLPPELVERIFEQLLRLDDRPTPDHVRASVVDFYSACRVCRYLMVCAFNTRLCVEALLRRVRPVRIAPPRCFFNLYLAQERSAIVVRSLKGALRALVTHCASDHCIGARSAYNLQERLHFAPPNDPLLESVLQNRVPVLKAAWRRSEFCTVAVAGDGSAVVAHTDGFSRVREWSTTVPMPTATATDAHAPPPRPNHPRSELGVAIAGLMRAEGDFECELLAATPTHAATHECAPDGRGRIRISSAHCPFESHIDTQGDHMEFLWFSETLLWAIYSTHAGHERLNLRAIDIRPPHVVRHCSFPDVAMHGLSLGLLCASTASTRLAMLLTTSTGAMAVFTELETCAQSTPMVHYVAVGEEPPSDALVVGPTAITLMPPQTHYDAVVILYQSQFGEAFCRVWTRRSPSSSPLPFVSSAPIRINDALPRQHSPLNAVPWDSLASPCGRFLVYTMVNQGPAATGGLLLVVDLVLSTSCVVVARSDAMPTCVEWTEHGIWMVVKSGALLLGWTS